MFIPIQQLCYYIDLYTDYGKDFPLSEAFYEGTRVEDIEDINLINNFSIDEWLLLQEYIKNKSSAWVECLLYILDEADTSKARQMVVCIALNGTNENFLDAIEYIRDIKEYKLEFSQDIWRKLEARSNQVIRNRLGLKP